MGKPTGFLEYEREVGRVEPPEERLWDFREFSGEKRDSSGRRSYSSGLGARSRASSGPEAEARRGHVATPATTPWHTASYNQGYETGRFAVQNGLFRHAERPVPPC